MNESDASVYIRVIRESGALTAVKRLHREMLHGDATTVLAASLDLRDFVTGRELAAIKRHLKSLP